LAHTCAGGNGRMTGEDAIPTEAQHRRDLDTLADMLKRLRPSSSHSSKRLLLGPLPPVLPASPSNQRPA
jgi:hypothetical protein